ncbi:HlyD family secretion protein [Pseudomonas sp. 5P_3.1_Bac2]|uniref:efflux RND transporter periplasmic adaptor subunit n=1 Tax=Pseudomonas sp. 5P_3.1_Bac2 TaxID=2971617 RepID=UPI0021C963A3|nr:HlyD family secretion protein [Pseudomonas sp. 5P_3.1_Bac2]MCU1717897.1 HlyD family secretion protein [Pseudomonas sp. 5P_3.1_Bac2]
MSRQSIISFVATLIVLLLAIWLGQKLWFNYMESPWTRDGRVRADIVTVAPDVSGLVVEVAVKDNQEVKKGDLLMRIDPDRYELAVKQAKALVAARKAALDRRQDNANRRAALNDRVVSREDREDAVNDAGEARGLYQQAQAMLAEAELNLKRTAVLSPVDGYVTNRMVHPGDYARAGDRQLAVVDRHSFWVYGYFEETKLQKIRLNDQVQMRLMDGQVMKGHVHSFARAIYDRDNPESRDLIADVNPTFNWVRLAQRVPVRISLDEVPQSVMLSAGLTCTVTVIEPRLQQSEAAPQ